MTDQLPLSHSVSNGVLPIHRWAVGMIESGRCSEPGLISTGPFGDLTVSDSGTDVNASPLVPTRSVEAKLVDDREAPTARDLAEQAFRIKRELAEWRVDLERRRREATHRLEQTSRQIAFHVLDGQRQNASGEKPERAITKRAMPLLGDIGRPQRGERRGTKGCPSPRLRGRHQTSRSDGVGDALAHGDAKPARPRRVIII